MVRQRIDGADITRLVVLMRAAPRPMSIQGDRIEWPAPVGAIMTFASATESPVPPSFAVPRLVLLLSLSVFAASLILVAVLLYRHLSYRNAITRTARTELADLTSRAAGSIDSILREAMASTQSLAEGLSSRTLSHEAALSELKASLERNPRAYGGTITYRPYGYDGRQRLKSDYCVRRGGRLDHIDLARVYDYTRPEYEWYGAAMTNGAWWTSPYFDEAAGTTMITYSVPFERRDPEGGTPERLGVVTVDLSMEEIRTIIESLNLGPSGFGALVSGRGVYLHHPIREFVIARKTLREVSREQNDPDRIRLAEAAEQRGTGMIDHSSRSTGLGAWLVYAPIPSAGWSLQNTFIKEDLPVDFDEMRRQLTSIAAAATLLVMASLALALRIQRGDDWRCWWMSAATAAVLAAGIGFVWKVSLTYDPYRAGTGVRVNDRGTLGNLMRAQERGSAERHTEPPLFVPTGIFVESARFSTDNDFSVTGYVWQKYREGEHDHLSRGFMFSDASELEISENYRQREGGIDFLRWYFRATIRQNVDHTRYPLEQAKLGIKIVHKDLNHNVVLVPDLAAYRLLNPASLPGLDKTLRLPGWKIEASYFELSKQEVVDTNFGVDRSMAKEDFPSLHFSVVIKRNLLDAFISNLTSLIIVAILLFTLIMVASRDERLVSFLQAGSGRILNICAAMFFIVAFTHIDVRRRIAAETVFYLEYFYFVIYVGLLWVSVNSVLFSTGRGMWLIQYRENYLPKLLYWPVLLGSLFVVTLIVFR